MRLFVPLTKTEFDALRELARAERRRPQDQAAVMLCPLLEPGDRAVTSGESNGPLRDLVTAASANREPDRAPA